MPESLRLFVAIELPGEVREALSRIQHELQRRGIEKLRWVRPEGIHLTLKFLGETPAQRVPAIQEALAEAVAGINAHELSLGNLGTFGGSRPRVLWIDLTGDLDTVRELQERTETALNALGFAREARGWSPHVTLARVRPEAARDIAGVITAAMAGVNAPPGVIPVRELSLMRSTLRPSGAVYERIAAFPLGGAWGRVVGE
jgi:2'-5' RNA ligase